MEPSISNGKEASGSQRGKASTDTALQMKLPKLEAPVISYETDPGALTLGPEDIKQAKRRIIKNVLIVSFAFMLLFTAFQSMSALQSSINKARVKIIVPYN